MARQKEKNTMEKVLDAVTDGVFSVDSRWRITSFNHAAELITGIKEKDALGKKCSEVFHADICERGCALRQCIETGKELRGIFARILNARRQSIPVIVNTALVKDKTGKTVKAIEAFRDISELELLRHEIEQKYSLGDLVGKSKSFGKILATLPELAQSDSAILIEGAAGTGKELMARTIHNLSPRHKKDFLVIDCKTLPASTLDAELFGYEQGSKPKKTKAGKLALAQGSTLYFDGIEKLPLPSQVKLLRVLQEREFEPLGSTKTIRTDVRIMASSRSTLAGLVSKGQFRDDLYFKLATIHLTLSPLQDRRMDIPLLLKRFIKQFNATHGKNIEGIESDVLESLMEYSYPGNITELRDMVEYACTLCDTEMISARHLPAGFRLKMARKGQGRGLDSIDSSHENSIREAIRQADGHLGHAADMLGISRTTLWRRMKRLGIKTGEFK